MENKQVFLLSNFELVTEKDGEADASAISLNPNLRWAKFVFTDDLPNLNKKRIPKEEFLNIIKTGIHMPIKMATGKINDGHDQSIPLGVISHLKEDGNKVIGLAALWATEREDDVNLLKSMKEGGATPQLSWEVYYGDSTQEEDVEVLRQICVKATTIVGIPAYNGRTPILAIASEEDRSQTHSSNEEENVEELQAKIAELEAKISELTSKLSENDAAIKNQESELTSLREYKAAIEKLEDEAKKLASIKTKFKDAGIEKEETYFEEKKDKFLSLDESDVDFMIQEMVAFSTKKVEASSKNPEIPNLPATTFTNDPKELAKALLEMGRKSK